MGESSVTLVSTKTEDPRQAGRDRIRNRKRLHESVRHGFKPERVMEIVNRMRALGYTYAQIADWLNGWAYVSPQGKQFYPNTVRRLLEDPIDYVD